MQEHMDLAQKHLDSLTRDKRYCDQSMYDSIEWTRQYPQVLCDLYDLLVAAGVSKQILDRLMVSRTGPTTQHGRVQLGAVDWQVITSANGLTEYVNRLRKSSDETEGVYQKYTVERTDGGSSPGGRHEKCRYFVIDIDHDKFAKAAMLAYSLSCESEFPKLAADLRQLIKEQPCTG